ncbi:MAG TPA: response regulator transcription factor [Noviherbaspirillum sp.]|nr:response regulator transcription factor [Noviherbaspirillum sp.]
MSIACYISDDAISHNVQQILTLAGFECERFRSETALLRTLRHRNFDLILVHVNIAPPADERVFSWLNCRTGESTPVVLLSSTQSPDRIAFALDSGADDFIATPFDPVELIARLHAVLRRCNRRNLHRAIEVLGFSLDRESGRFLDRGVELELTPREFTMAWLFFSSPGVYLSRETISIAVWGVESEIANRTIEQHIYKLRKKLQLSKERGVMIRTAYSQGYRLELCGEEVMAA